MSRNKRLTIALLLAALIAGLFWSQSRIPALNEKAQMGLRTSFGDIAFEILLPISAADSLPERVFRTGVNWGYTNLQGMFFGLLFAGAILTILSNLRTRQFRQPWLNTVAGIFVGAPLGVCVNCATPIAFGIYSAGARLETALASLVASPTLNVIVLTMSFALLPWEIALAKLIGVFLVLSCIPVLVRRLSGDVDASKAGAVARSLPLPPPRSRPADDLHESFATAFFVTAKDFLRNLAYLTRFALPLMVLAGFLGALVIEVLPFEQFSDRRFGAGSLLVVALMATFLPVPIAFDVVIVMALLAGGVDIGLAATILFGLGIYSVYPAAMIARYISLRLSLALASVVIVIAAILGFSMHQYFENKTNTEEAQIISGLSSTRAEILQQAVDNCDSLPDHLQERCFVQHIDNFDNVAGGESLCRTRPGSLSFGYCEHIVERHKQAQLALAEGNSERCNLLPEANARLNCAIFVTLKLAQRDNDIRQCDQLPDRRTVSACRTEFLNARILFRPDDSACEGLRGREAGECAVNVAIYRYADTLDLDACDTLNPESAGDLCRYTIASTMIGWQNDSSGCRRIASTSLRERCESLTIAWQASREQSFERCATLEAADLRDTCLLRVADSRIQGVLARYMLSQPGDANSSERAQYSRDAAGQGTSIGPPAVEWASVGGGSDDVGVTFAPYSVAERKPSGRFRQLSADALGISHAWNFRRTDFFEPFIYGKGIASGDFNNDLWPDLVLASERGLWVYRNIGGRYEMAKVEQGELGTANVFVVAFVDADGDGQQDIFASTYGGKNYVLLNVDGGFESATLQELGGSKRLALSAGFGDLNRDGQLDIVLGNWSSGIEKLFSTVDSANSILYRDGGGYREQSLSAIKGETNSVLIADIDGDDVSDLLVGNDQLVPDMFYVGEDVGSRRPLMAKNGIVPATSMFTMSLDTADFNNDLEIDIFSTDMTFARSSRENYCAALDNAAKDHCESMLNTYRLFREGGAGSCNSLTDTLERNACFVAFSVRAAKELKDHRFCRNLPDKRSATYSLCEYLATPAAPAEPIDQNQYVLQHQRNTLLLGIGGSFVERAETLGVDKSFWSWNAKAADIDNDGWPDIYVGNGFHFGENFYEIQDNIMFRNMRGNGFEQMQSEWGLNDPINTPSYTYTDIDLDGDLDIVATGVLAPPRVFVNELAVGNSITVVLRDDRGNSAAIGAKVTIRYGGSDGYRQRKENKLSGGFLSFDNPVLHFGIGKHTQVDEIVVRWPDGQETVVAGPLDASRSYRLHRRR